MRKPSRPAWLVNRIALKHPERMGDLVAAANRLRELDPAQTDELREAAQAEREAVDRLVELAAEELGTVSGSGAVLDRVRETLQAVAADAEVRAEAQAGRLVRERRVATLGAGAVAGSPRKSEPRRARRRTTAGDREAELRRARAEVRRLRKRANTDRARERRAQAALERAEAKAERARDALEEAEAKAESARRALDDARSRLAGAEAELSESERRVSELEEG